MTNTIIVTYTPRKMLAPPLVLPLSSLLSSYPFPSFSCPRKRMILPHTEPPGCHSLGNLGDHSLLITTARPGSHGTNLVDIVVQSCGGDDLAGLCIGIKENRKHIPEGCSIVYSITKRHRRVGLGASHMLKSCSLFNHSTAERLCTECSHPLMQRVPDVK